MPENDSDNRRAVDKVAWKVQLGQDIWDRTSGTGQPDMRTAVEQP